MTAPDSRLERAFLEDHRTFTAGLERILKALLAEDDALAVELAKQLDRDVGPHIEFEEEQFYPALRERLGSGFVTQLYGEHATGQRAIAGLVAFEEPPRLEPERRAELIEALERTLEHVSSCGSLLSHLSALSAGRQAKLLERLQQIRRRPTRWTQRRARGHASRGSRAPPPLGG